MKKGRTTSKVSEKFAVTVAFDEEMAKDLRELSRNLGVSQSEVMRTALKFYTKHKSLFDSIEEEKIYIYVEMLSAGEHVILDMDHWMLFLKYIGSHPEQEQFWEMHRKVSRAHAEEFINKNHDVEVVLERLEACNLFKLSKTSKTDFTLILGYDVPKKFIMTELEDIFYKMDLHAEIKEDLSKLRVKISTLNGS